MRTALITGASRGIGAVIKNLFQENGIEVYSPTRTEMDLNSNKSIEKYINSLDADIDILVNNAGLNNLAGIEEINDEKQDQMLQINLVAQMRLIKLLSTGMVKRRYGKIVNMASIWCDYSKERRILYSIAKAGVKGLTTAAAVELSKYNILVNAVAPGFVNTEMTAQNNTPDQIKELSESLPIKRLADPIEIAELVYFLCSDKNTYVTGQTIYVDGGFSCV